MTCFLHSQHSNLDINIFFWIYIIQKLRLEKAGDFFITAWEGKGREDESKLIGFVNGTKCKGETLRHETMADHDEEGNTLCMHSVCVQEEKRRKKVGQKMLQRYLEHVKEKRKEVGVVLLICKEQLINFYESVGFELVGPSDVVHGKDKWYELKLRI